MVSEKFFINPTICLVMNARVTDCISCSGMLYCFARKGKQKMGKNLWQEKKL